MTDAPLTLDLDGLSELSLCECPPGLFLFNGHLGLKTEYGAMETVGPTNVSGSEIRWVVGRYSEVYVADSGEAFWGGATTKDEREKLLVEPVSAEALITEVRRLREEVDSLKQRKWDVKHVDTINDMVAMGLARDEAEARATAAEAQRDEAREALRACRDQFAFYADEHRKAGKHEKALTNQAFADRADTALSVIEGSKP